MSNREIKFRAGCKFHKATMDIIHIHWWGDKIETTHQCGCPDIEILQFTGVKDMHGKEIYEGDLIRNQDRILEVIWYGCGFIGSGRRGAIASGETNYHLLADGKIIGNIYSNPELVKPC